MLVLKLSMGQHIRIVHSSLLYGGPAITCTTKCCHRDIINHIVCSNNNRSKADNTSDYGLPLLTIHFDLRHVYYLFAQLEHTSQETFKTAVQTLRTASQEERVELAQKVERTAEKALSTLTAANQRNVEAESRQLQSFMSQLKEDLTAHATEVCIYQHCIATCMNECLYSFKCICIVMVEITK